MPRRLPLYAVTNTEIISEHQRGAKIVDEGRCSGSRHARRFILKGKRYDVGARIKRGSIVFCKACNVCLS